MPKYYNELDRQANCGLPFVDCLGFGKKVKYEFIPLEYIDKYSDIIKLLRKIDEMIRFMNVCDVELLFRKKTTECINYAQSQEAFTNYEFLLISKAMLCGIDSIVSMSEEERHNYLDGHIYETYLPSIDEIMRKDKELEYQLKFYCFALQALLYYYPELENTHRELFVKMENAIKEINPVIHFEKFTQFSANVMVPDSWYITPYGHLYNSPGKKGHKDANLVNARALIENVLVREIENCSIPSSKSNLDVTEYFDKLETIDVVTYMSEYKLGVTHNFPFIFKPYKYITDAGEEITKYLPKEEIASPIVKKLLIGVESAHAAYFSFFEELMEYTKDPVKEYAKLKSWTRDISDILVQAAGFHKIETNIPKTITTSRFFDLEYFSEYINKGWNICYIPPIMIDREQGVLVNKVETMSLLEEGIIDEYINEQEKKREANQGLVYKYDKVNRRGKIF